jgi:hypothetical protein
MPITPPQKKGGPRSPGSALPAFDSVVRPGGLLVVKDAGEKRAGVFAGQLAVVRDSSGGDDLRVTLLTGLEVGQAVSLPRRQLELYTAPVSRQLISATYSLGRELGRYATQLLYILAFLHSLHAEGGSVRSTRPSTRELVVGLL